MKTVIPLILFILYVYILPAQHLSPVSNKPSIDTSQLLNWPVVAGWPYPFISNNGEYLLYSVWRIPRGSATMMIQSINKNWRIALEGVNQAAFTADSRYVVFITPFDSLCILTLSNLQRYYAPEVNSFKLFLQADKDMIIYQQGNKHKDLILRDLTCGIQHSYKNIDHYSLNEDGTWMLLQTEPDTSHHVMLLSVDLLTNESKTIWKGKNLNNVCIHELGKQAAFLVYDSTTMDNTVWLYTVGQEKAVELLPDRCINLVESMELVSIDDFSKDGKKLFIQIKKKAQSNRPGNLSPVTIWNYRDTKLQSLQANELSKGASSFLATLDLEGTRSIWRIQQENEMVDQNKAGQLILLTHLNGKSAERYWNKEAASHTYLAILNKKKRIPIPLSMVKISPKEKYLIGYGTNEIWGSDLFVYEIATNTTRNITENLTMSSGEEASDIVRTSKGRSLRLAGWLPGDTGLLIYDYYDIWEIDPLGKRKPVRLTSGREKKIQFRLAEEDRIQMEANIHLDHVLLLIAFNCKTKQHGFYKLKLPQKKEPELLFMGNCLFTKIGESNSFFVKARDKDVYLVRKEQADKAPNIFSTTNFLSFAPLSHIYPENSINWLSSELVSFTTIDKTSIQAVLYKPQNFNPANKYPLIIHYYEKKSDELNRYQFPATGSGGDLDVAWFVSHGYMVLLPDIHYKIGQTGESAYKAIVSAAKHLSRRPYIDEKHIGIQGHSFGGYETNYLITHSDLFAAAVSSSGVSDPTTKYGSLWPDGSGVQEYFESRSYRINAPPWRAPATYGNNSPIFSAGLTTTPTLMINNKKDKNVWFEQGLELFIALRSSGKRAWMLQYDNGGHGLQGEEEYKDCLLKTTQFFDHYLRGRPAPKWMTRGIPAAMKSIDNGAIPDNTITTPGEGLLIKK